MDYQKHYSLLIESRKQSPTESDYYEKHHILPRSLGGSDVPENIIQLTAREHYMAHRLLAKMHGGKMWFALWIMSNGAKPSSKRDHLVTPGQYEYARKMFSKRLSETHPFKGKKNVITSAFRGWDAKRIEYDWSTVNCIHSMIGFECYWRYRGHTWTQERRKPKAIVSLNKYFVAYGNRGDKNATASSIKWVWQHCESEQIVVGTLTYCEEKYGIQRGSAYNCTYGKCVTASGWLFLGPVSEEDVSREALDKIKAVASKYEGRSAANRKGVKFTDEHKQNISSSQKGKKLTLAHREKMSQAKRGKKLSREHREKLSKAGSGRPMPKSECSHCGKIGGVHVISRWHNDNCKKNPESSRYEG